MTPISKALVEKYSKALKIDLLGDPEVTRMVESCGRWWEALKSNSFPKWLSLLGSNGVGKTHCATKMLQWHVTKYQDQWSRCDYLPKVIHWPSLIEDMRPGGDNDQQKQRVAFYRNLRYWPLLVLDEVGSEHDPNGWSSDKISSLLGCRDGRWTVITSNLTLEKMAVLDRRIVSRMFRHGGIVSQTTTKDYGLR